MDTQTKESEDGNLIINTAFEGLLQENGITSLLALWGLPGEVVRKELPERSTERVILASGSDKIETYIKRFLPLPVREYFKAITSCVPLFPSGALHEWEAIVAFHREEIPTMVPIAVGRDSSGRSALLTLGVQNCTPASELFKTWHGDRSKRQQRRKLIANIATLAGRMHSAKFAHHDFYLVHLFVGADLTVLPIDLHRVIMQSRFGRKWRVKDLGQLLYSAMGCTTMTDRLYFWKKYTDIAGTELYKDKALLKAIFKTATRIYMRER